MPGFFIPWKGDPKGVIVTDAGRDLAALAEEFWDWRARTQPDSGDDVPRVERPPGWVADWSAGAVAERRRTLEEFTVRFRALDLSGEPLAVQVDGRLLESALARVHWELDLLRGWQRNPRFYLDQALVPLFNLLLVPPPFEAERAAAITRHLRRVRVVLGQGRDNLAGHAAAPFAEQTLRMLGAAAADLNRAMNALASVLPETHTTGLLDAAKDAAQGLEAFREWLGRQLFAGDAGVGPEAMTYFLHRVALLPYSSDQLRDLARAEFNRAVVAEAVLRRRVGHDSVREPPRTVAELVERERADEIAVRDFWAVNGLLVLPADLRHYVFAAMPPYLEPLTWLGVAHDITSPARAAQDAVCYTHPPADDTSYFARAKSADPRTGIVHEGVHALQMALSWQHLNPARRRYYDSAPNEGIAFHNEELMLQAGLFNDAPGSAVFVANSMRLRALRVDVDIRLALGDLTIDEAADHMAETVPMDHPTAWEEAVFFAGNPGQGLSYQAGKAQILDLLAECERRSDAFDLREFHERLWREGNVPLTLQRWEFLGLDDHLARQGTSAAVGVARVRSG